MSMLAFMILFLGCSKFSIQIKKKKVECKEMFEEQPSVVLIKTAGNL